MITIPVYNKQSQSTETVSLGTMPDRKNLSPRTYACAIRALIQNWRQGTASCKSRGEVAFSNKKPWRQKGTGRARVSSLRSPLWRKGGIIFGPQPRVREIGLHASQKRLVFNNILFSMLDKKAVACIDFELTTNKPSTKLVREMLSNVGFDNKKIILFLGLGDELTAASFRNIPNVGIVTFDQPNAYQLSDGDCWVFLKKDLESFNRMVTQWN